MKERQTLIMFFILLLMINSYYSFGSNINKEVFYSDSGRIFNGLKSNEEVMCKLISLKISLLLAKIQKVMCF